MIALKLVFQSLAGVGSVLACAGGGYYVLNSGETIPSENIIVLFSGTTSNADASSQDGYLCKVSSSTPATQSAEDKNCQIYSLNTTGPNTSIDFSKIISKPENKVSGNLTASNKYILTISKTTFDSVSATDKSIEIFKAKSPTTKLIKFSPKVTLEGTIADPKPNLIFAQAFQLPATENAEALGTDKKYFCEFLDSASSNKFECDIYKNGTTGNTLTDVQFSALTKSTAATDITKANYFVIDLKSQTLAKSQLRNKKIKLSIGTQSTSQEVATFLYEQSLVGDLSSANKFVYRISPSREIYYVVKMGAKGDVTAPELKTSVAGDQVQNYKCQLDSIDDTSCKLFTLPSFTASKNSVTHDEVLAANESSKIADLISETYFKISLNPSNIDTLSWDGSANKTITIVSTDTTPKTYATLKIIAKEKEEKIKGKTSLVLGKIKEVTPGTATTFSCSITSGTAQSCTALIFNEQLQAQQTTKNLKFEAMTEKTTLAAEDTGKYLLLDLKEQSFEFEELKTKEVEVSVTSSGTTTKFTLTDLTPLAGKSSTTATNNKVIFLN